MEAAAAAAAPPAAAAVSRSPALNGAAACFIESHLSTQNDQIVMADDGRSVLLLPGLCQFHPVLSVGWGPVKASCRLKAHHRVLTN